MSKSFSLYLKIRCSYQLKIPYNYAIPVQRKATGRQTYRLSTEHLTAKNAEAGTENRHCLTIL
jgi:hypothetical protein